VGGVDEIWAVARCGRGGLAVGRFSLLLVALAFGLWTPVRGGW